MRLAVEFKRFGAVRFVSHLDMQRTVMRAVRRTALEPEYSQGFNPHMLMSFASAMPVGLQSDSEYLELKLIRETPLDFCLSELKKSMPEGITPVWTGKLSDNAPKLMAALKYAGYEAMTDEKYWEHLKKQVENILQSDNIEAVIERKGKVTKKDIRPLIYSIEKDDNENKLNMILGMSSEGSLNPEVLFKVLEGRLGSGFDWSIKRTGLFTVIGGGMQPLRKLCE